MEYRGIKGYAVQWTYIDGWNKVHTKSELFDTEKEAIAVGKQLVKDMRLTMICLKELKDPLNYKLGWKITYRRYIRQVRKPF